MEIVRYDENGRLLPYEDVHRNAGRRPHFTCYSGLAKIALLLKVIAPSWHLESLCFALYRWAANRHELLFLPKPLTLSQRRENAAAWEEWYAAFQKERSSDEPGGEAGEMTAVGA